MYARRGPHIYGGNMLTNDDLNAIKSIFKEQFKEGIKGVEERLDGVESRLDGVESILDGVENRLDNLEHEVKVIRVDILENNVIPRLNTIEQCYVDTSRRYLETSEKFETAIADIDVMKLAIQKNSQDIQELKLKKA